MPKNSNRPTHNIFTSKNSYLNGCRSSCHRHCRRDSDALMTCEQTSGILTLDQNIYAVTVQRQPALQETEVHNSLCVRVSDVSWRPLANVSPGRLRRAIQICYLSASWHLLQLQLSEETLAGVSLSPAVLAGHSTLVRLIRLCVVV